MRNAPKVNINTNLIIGRLIGTYNENNQKLIHDIAKNEKVLLEGCSSILDYQNKISDFILNHRIK